MFSKSPVRVLLQVFLFIIIIKCYFNFANIESVAHTEEVNAETRIESCENEIVNSVGDGLPKHVQNNVHHDA